jgi:protein-tyrosine phosphatase
VGRSWPVLGVVLAAFVVLGVHLAADWLNREPPNYSQIEEGLYLGGYVQEPPPGATAVLNLCEAEDPYQVAAHRWEPIPDAEPAPSREWLGQQVRFVEDQRKAGRGVFVHCRNGVSRSGLVVVAHLMTRHGWSRDEALAFVQSRRAVVRPHPAFMRLLQEWERAR